MIYDHFFADALVPLWHERRYRVFARGKVAREQGTPVFLAISIF